jgi:hypothetical protein
MNIMFNGRIVVAYGCGRIKKEGIMAYFDAFVQGETKKNSETANDVSPLVLYSRQLTAEL